MKKAIIGCEEWLSIKDLNIPIIKARIDSGAKTSSIQAKNIKKIIRNGETWVIFDVCPIQDNSSLNVSCESKVIDIRIIRSSTGESQKRYVIKTNICIGQIIFEVELTLAERDGMEYRMLLGREALSDRFLVDSSKRFNYKNYNDDEVLSLYKHLFKKSSGLKMLSIFNFLGYNLYRINMP